MVCLDPLAWVRGGLTTNPGMFLLGQPGAGKALSLDTPVPVPAGWTAMGDLRVGDYVFDDAGRPVPVMAVSEVMTGRACLEIRFDEAAAIIADADHQWVTVAAAAAVTAGNGPGDAGPGGTAIRTTRQIMDTLTGSGGEPAHSVSAAGPLQLPGVYLPVPPWLLGCWLAGGADSEGRLTVLRDRLTELGLLPGPPHIPRRYLRAAWRQRRELLAGILDTAGRTPARGVAAWAARQRPARPRRLRAGLHPGPPGYRGPRRPPTTPGNGPC